LSGPPDVGNASSSTAVHFGGATGKGAVPDNAAVECKAAASAAAAQSGAQPSPDQLDAFVAASDAPISLLPAAHATLPQ
jgi:hypothetical protein